MGLLRFTEEETALVLGEGTRYYAIFSCGWQFLFVVLSIDTFTSTFPFFESLVKHRTPSLSTYVF